MKTLNPRVFLREGELYALTEPIWPISFHEDSDEENEARKQQTIKRAKASAIKVKNQDEAVHWLSQSQWQRDIKPDSIYTLEGYQMEVVEERRYIPATVKLAIISPVVEPRQIKIGDTFYVEGHERSHTCVGYEGEDIVAENNLPYQRSKCSLTPTVVEQEQEPKKLGFYPVIESEEELQRMIKKRIAAGVDDTVNGKSEYALAWRQCLDFVLDRYIVIRKPPASTTTA